MAKIAWLGLGVMGYPMAGHLATRGGHNLTVYNRSAQKASAWVAQYGSGNAAATPASAVVDADFVFACVGNDDDLRAVTTGPDGAFPSMKPGSIFADHTTASAAVARELKAVASERGIDFLDCPVSGGQAGAEAGTLTIMCGGDASAYATAEPVMSTYARSVRRIGPSGAGQLTKMVNQIAVAGVIQGLAEAIHFAEQADLDEPVPLRCRLRLGQADAVFEGVAHRVPGQALVVELEPLATPSDGVPVIDMDGATTTGADVYPDSTTRSTTDADRLR